MTAWKRWQDWATVLLGVILFATPFIFQTTSETAAAWTAYVMGVLLAGSGLWAASTDEPTLALEWVPFIVAAALFAAPWVLNYTASVVMAWMAWIIGALGVINAGGELIFLQKPATA